MCSQTLILPPFQGEGHGAQLLETVHRYYCTSAKVQDITGMRPRLNVFESYFDQFISIFTEVFPVSFITGNVGQDQYYYFS